MTQTGGDTVTYYQVECDIGNTGVWVPLTTEWIGLTSTFNHSRSTPFPSEETILYRVRPKNGVGLGAASDILGVIADSVPTFMTPPTIDISANHINPRWMYLTWTALTDF